MQFDYRYLGKTEVRSGAHATSMQFVPDASRDPTFFRGQLAKKIAFREAISALHDVVISDMRFKPKDRGEYMEWLQRQELYDYQQILADQAELQAKAETLQRELEELEARERARKQDFYKQRQKYFNYIYRVNYDAWYVLDPVITVHPDEIFFECFSQDESSYGRLGASYEVFQDIGEFACGTTNIDYSQGLYDEFQKIRDYKATAFEVDPSGFEVQTEGEEDYREVKIDLPETWVRGFLQVSSAMSLPARTLELHPFDVYNICQVLRRFKEKRGPRSLRWHLKPGEPVRLTFDPWGFELECPRSLYMGDEEDMIRTWGRRRIHILERLIPIANRFTVHLLGRGLPTFYVADLGHMTFTLGLSGWTRNDWSQAGNFDLLAPRAQVDSETATRVFEGLRQHWMATPETLARDLSLEKAQVLGALGIYTQAGRVMYDLDKNVYRLRELSRDPLPMDALRYRNEREQLAARLRDAGAVSIQRVSHVDGLTHVEATVRDGHRTEQVELWINSDERVTKASCTCSFYRRNRMMQGPCEHILATRLVYDRSKDE